MHVCISAKGRVKSIGVGSLNFDLVLIQFLLSVCNDETGCLCFQFLFSYHSVILFQNALV